MIFHFMHSILHFVIIGSCMTGPCFYRFKNIPYKIILRGVMLCKNNCNAHLRSGTLNTISKKALSYFFFTFVPFEKN